MITKINTKRYWAHFFGIIGGIVGITLFIRLVTDHYTTLMVLFYAGLGSTLWVIHKVSLEFSHE